MARLRDQHLLQRAADTWGARLVPLGMCAFWVINAGYQVVIPFPVPRSLTAVRWSLLAFPVIVAACYGVAFRAATRAPR